MPPHLRGTAIGGFAAFQDLAYGATGPVAGVLADYSGCAPVFLIGGIAATLGLWMVLATDEPLHRSGTPNDDGSKPASLSEPQARL